MSKKSKRPSVRRLVRRALAKGEKLVSSQAPSEPASVQFQGHERVEVAEGMTVLHAAIRTGVDLSHYCGGNCSCGSCRIIVVSGGEFLTKPQHREALVLGPGRLKAGERLGCQARIVGPVQIHIPDYFMGS